MVRKIKSERENRKRGKKSKCGKIKEG